MKVLVTGADGFLGRHTVKYLRHRGHDVVSYTNDILQGLPFENFDVVIPFAAYVGGRKGIDNNKWLIAKNIELDRLTFEWAEKHCKTIIYPSSCAGYPLYLQELPGTFMYEEQFGVAKTFDLYGLSKIISENMLKLTNVHVHVVRPFSVYGPGQSLDYPLPDIIARARQGECSVWGSGTQTRDWVYVDDAVKIFELLLNSKTPTTVNIATGKSTSFTQLAKIVYKLIHGISIPVKTQTEQPEGAGHRVGSTERMEKLGLSCPTTIETGIGKILQC